MSNLAQEKAERNRAAKEKVERNRAALGSNRKFLVQLHGALMPNTFRVPPGVFLVFLTYPGVCSNPHRFWFDFDEDEADKYFLGKQPEYSVTYVPGDLVSDYALGLHDYFTGVFKIQKNRIEKIKDFGGRMSRVIDSFRRITLRNFLPKLMTSLPKGQGPLVLFMANCRTTNDDETMKRSWNMNERARARMGASSLPQNIADTHQAFAKYSLNQGWKPTYTDEYLKKIKYPKNKPRDDKTIAFHEASVTIPYARRLGPFDPRAALRVLRRRRR